MSWLGRVLTVPRLFGTLCIIVLAWGYQAPLGRVLTPERGLGYALGIIGGSLMLLLLLYPARKRARWLGFIGGIPGWFRTHMVLGVLGPICILFHANFQLGAINSNVALFCMLAVAGSGVAGRYMYSRIYDNLHGRQATVAELQAIAQQLRSQGTTVAVLPHLMDRIEAEERRLLAPSRSWVGRMLGPLSVGPRAFMARRRLAAEIRHAVRDAASGSRVIAPHAHRLVDTANYYAVRRLDASRRVSEYQFYARVFSLWHLAHVPLFIMLLIAGIAHVISVNIY